MGNTFAWAKGFCALIMVQSISASDAASTIRKTTEHENLAAVRRGGIRILLHAWAKRRGRWVLREVDLS